MLFLTGFSQVFLVALNVYQISHFEMTHWLCHTLKIALVGFGISFLWTLNVTGTAFGGTLDKFVYAFGAMSGTVSGVLVGQFLEGKR